MSHLHFVARFRTSHSRNRHQFALSGFRLFLLVGIMVMLTYLFQKIIQPHFFLQSGMPLGVNQNEIFYLPESDADTIIHNRFFSSGLSVENNQPLWVAYELSQARLKGPMVKGTTGFKEERESDFLSPDYIKGYLVPVADRSFSKEALKETLQFNNIAPQLFHFNKGIWRELEEQVRAWVDYNRRLIILCGPVFDNPQSIYVGSNRLSIPNSFFKVILDINEIPPQAIGFIFPHQIQEKKLIDFAVSVDRVEEYTGIDFFPELFTDTLEEQIEQDFSKAHWSFDFRLYEMRINKWNKLERDE